jgi:predicted enzyme related to lactoylglutathione lyase
MITSVAISVSACSIHQEKSMEAKMNPALYFEIPVSDMQRAINFYERVFGFDFELEDIHGNQMALMPFDIDGSGISGALAKGEIYQPSQQGTLIYLRTESIDNTLERAELLGAKVLFPKTKAGEYSYVAEIEDSEGNRIGLMEPLP